MIERAGAVMVVTPNACRAELVDLTLRPIGSVLGLRLPGLEFRILCQTQDPKFQPWRSEAEQCHLTHIIILRRFSWPSVACLWTNLA